MQSPNPINLKNLPSPLQRKGIEKLLSRILQENDVVFMGIFGSYARGENRRGSDVDIAIEFKKDAKKSLLDLVGLQIDLSKVFRRKVNIGEIDSINPLVIDYVRRDLKVIYEKR
jgi:predicted nucleotidyltransferase